MERRMWSAPLPDASVANADVIMSGNPSRKVYLRTAIVTKVRRPALLQQV